MGSIANRQRLLSLAVVSVLAAIVAACATDPSGHLFTAINESDRDLVVRVDSDHPVTVRLAAHTRGTLSSGWDYAADWHLTVMDTSCTVLGSKPVAGPGTVLTIAAGGTLETDPDRRAFDLAAERWQTDLEPSTCRRP